MDHEIKELSSDFEAGHGKRRETYLDGKMTLREINTVDGYVPEGRLHKRRGKVDNDNEVTHWIEYYRDGVMVQRSVHVALKKNVAAEGVAAMLA